MDISVCLGKGCSDAPLCYRFIEFHRDEVDSEYQSMVEYVEDESTGRCAHYWDKEEKKKKDDCDWKEISDEYKLFINHILGSLE